MAKYQKIHEGSQNNHGQLRSVYFHKNYRKRSNIRLENKYFSNSYKHTKHMKMTNKWLIRYYSIIILPQNLINPLKAAN